MTLRPGVDDFVAVERGVDGDHVDRLRLLTEGGGRSEHFADTGSKLAEWRWKVIAQREIVIR